jgi:hypothetical protein
MLYTWLHSAFEEIRMVTHSSSDQRRTSSIFAGQRNGTLILHASPNRQGFTIWITRLLALCVTAALVTGCGNPNSSALPPSQGTQNCAWPYIFNIQSVNVFAPDAAAFYWAQPIVADANTTIQISGRFPDARYASLSVYTPYGSPFTTNGVSSSLPDYRIQPQSGSQNPWQQSASPGGSFTVTIRSGATPKQGNILPMPVGTSSQHPGYLVYRVYLPASGTSSQIPLPTLTVVEGTASRQLPACTTHPPFSLPWQAPGATPTPGTPSTVPVAGRFYKLPQNQYNQGFGNADSAYLEAYFVRPAAADVVVITAKAPATPSGSHPTPWPDSNVDMRYWSMCIYEGTRSLPTVANTLPDGTTDYGCRADEVTKTNASGDYTYVIGDETQRAAIEGVPGVTFLPFSSTQSTRLYVMLLRNTLVSQPFTHAAQAVTQTQDPAAAAAAMGPYYPQVATCSLATLTTSGLPACMGGHP